MGRGGAGLHPAHVHQGDGAIGVAAPADDVSDGVMTLVAQHR